MAGLLNRGGFIYIDFSYILHKNYPHSSWSTYFASTICHFFLLQYALLISFYQDFDYFNILQAYLLKRLES